MQKQQNTIWHRGLLFVATFTAVFSLALIIFPQPLQNIFNELFFEQTPIFSEDATRYINLLYGIIGAVMFGWMMVFIAVLQGIPQRSSAHVWNILAGVVVVWYVLDTVHSLRYGFWQNAIFNTLFLIMFAIPLAGIRLKG